MRLPKPLRTSSFRFALLYAGGFAASALALFGIVTVSATGFMLRQIDGTVSGEVAEIRADLAHADTREARRLIDGLAAKSPGVLYLLQDPDGNAVAGNMRAIRPVPGVRTLNRDHERSGRIGGGLRGRGEVLPDGSYLFVGLSDFQLREMREAIAHAFLLGTAATIGLALACGLATSTRLLRRVEAIGEAGQAIMRGNLGERLPLCGTGDELDHLAAGLNAMLARIQTLMEDVRQVTNDIAHDLRTPLSRLRQRLELAGAREGTKADLRAALHDAIGQADAILATFAALLRIAQVEGGARRDAFTVVDLSLLLEALADAYGPVADERGQTLHCRVDAGLRVSGDHDLLNQLFSNLVENAITHTPPGTRLTVRAMADESQVHAAVADGGPGIPAAFRAKVTQRFFRLDASRALPGGGLGLSLAKAVAELHGGRLRFEDNQPGLRCVVTLPRNSVGGPSVCPSGGTPI